MEKSGMGVMVARLLALTVLSMGAARADLAGRLESAEAARRAGNLTEAYRILSRLLPEAPGDEQVNFSYGLTCLGLGDASRAELAFVRVLEINPGNHRARLELARALTASGRYGEARRELERVLASAPPDRVRQNVEAYLGQVRELEGRTPGRARGQIEVGAFRDSNVNAGPDTDVIYIRPQWFGFIEVDRLEVGEGSRPRRDYGLYLSGRGRIEFDPGRPGAWRAETGVSGYAGLMHEAHAYRLHYYQVHGALNRQSGPHQLQIPVRYTHLYRGGERLMQSTGVAASYSRMLPPGNNQRVTLHGDLQWRDYAGRGDRDGFYTFGGLALDQFFGRRRHLAGAGLTYYRDFAEAAIYEKIGVRWSLHGTLNLPWRSAAYTRLHYGVERYREREALAREDREDRQMQAAVGLRRQIGARLGVDVQHQHTRNESTFDLYDHRRDITTVSTTYVF